MTCIMRSMTVYNQKIGYYYQRYLIIIVIFAITAVYFEFKMEQTGLFLSRFH